MRDTTPEQTIKLMQLLISMGVEKQETIDIAAALETKEELNSFLDKLAEKNYDLTPSEVYKAAGETVNEYLKQT